MKLEVCIRNSSPFYQIIPEFFFSPNHLRSLHWIVQYRVFQCFNSHFLALSMLTRADRMVTNLLFQNILDFLFLQFLICPSNLLLSQISALEINTKRSLSDSLHIFKVISGSPGVSTLHGLPGSASSSSSV